MHEGLPRGCQLIALNRRADSRGSLVAVEGETDVPFAIARAYYIYGTPADVRRGFHAHRTLRQFAIALSGQCAILLDDGTTQVEVRLDHPAAGLLIEPMVWHEMADFSPDCVLLVLADQHFDEADYIRDARTFRALVAASDDR